MIALLAGDVLSLRAYVQLPERISAEFLQVLMETGVEDDAHAVIISAMTTDANL
jgi:hypothetical protein